MIDGASPLDPLLAEGPRVPMETLRPLVAAQRLLLLDTPDPSMVDFATGDIRRWENGPPVLLPTVSNRFDLMQFSRMQFQVLRDPRPSSVDLVLLSVQHGESWVDVVETVSRELQIRTPTELLASGPIGASSAVVIVLTPRLVDESRVLGISARNAEISDALECAIDPEGESAVVTIGGPSWALTGRHGRRRLIPAHLDVARPPEPIDQMGRAVRGARRVIGQLRDRV